MMILKPTISIGAVGAALAPTAAFVLHDLVFQLPDNQHEASPGSLLTVAGLLFSWALGGYLAGRRTRSKAAAATAGMTTAAISVGILWLTFMTLNLAFTDRMSYEPDSRIQGERLSHHAQVSGCPEHDTRSVTAAARRRGRRRDRGQLARRENP